MKKNILAENMKRFGTKNLNEQAESIPGEMIDKYIMSLKREDVIVVLGVLNPEEIYDNAYEASYDDDIYKKDVTLETPKFILNIELMANVAGGGNYGDDAEIQFEFFIDNVIDRATKRPIKVDYSAPYKEVAYLDYQIGELLGLY